MLESSVFGLTDIGRVRSANQDSIFMSAGAVGLLPNLFIVADGMGGHKGGEIASRLAISHFCDYLQGIEHFAEGTLDMLITATKVANGKILEQAQQQPELSGMGTTFTGCTIKDGKCEIIHIGDSRAYAITDRHITQLTHDHSYVNEMVRAGQITESEARGHPKRNVLTRVLGGDSEMYADGYIYDVEPGGIILLCSDGLYNMLSDNEIKEIVCTSETPAESLIAAANANGGADNISVILVR